MKMKNKYLLVAGLFSSMLLASCYEDKGNYVYSEIEKIEISLPTSLSVMANSEYIKFEPEIVSSVVGNVDDGNDTYEFNCKVDYRHTDSETGEYKYWLDINPDKKKNVNHFAKIPQGSYTIWYSVTNKKTGLTTNAKFPMTVLTSTYEGWLVLCNEGADKSVRLDMISKNSQGESLVSVDIVGDKAPELKEATQIALYPSMYAGQEAIYLMSKSGGYRLDVDKLTMVESNNMKFTTFIVSNFPGEPVSFISVCGSGAWIAPTSRFCVTTEGNAYAIRSAVSGASFEDPMNTTTPGGEPTYKVSPMTGTSMARPGNSTCVLCYDVTNKRFVGWNYNSTPNNLMFTLSDPEGADRKFSYQTGMELVHMEGTRYSNGLVYSVLQDAQGKRHIYGINLSGSRYTQESLYSDIAAEHFDDATAYAFHSQFPFMFYSYGNKVYSYNLGTGAINQVLELPAGESVTKLKFNLYVNAELSYLNNKTEEFLAKQFDLIVASTTGAENGGIVRFYDIDNSGKMSKLEEYTGFGDHIVDVTYRERR